MAIAPRETFSPLVSSVGSTISHAVLSRVVSRHQNERLSYDALDRKSNSLARGLVKLGVNKGDRVAVSLGNNIEHAIDDQVPLNPAFSSTQVVAALSHLDASHLIISTETNLPRKKPRRNEALLRDIIPGIESGQTESELVPSLKEVVVVDNSSGRVSTSAWKAVQHYQQVLEDGGSGAALLGRNLCPDDVVNIQFTSGTTSMPKAACLTHMSILNNGKSIGDRMMLTPLDIVCCPPPLFQDRILTHSSCFGCILGYMATATHGSSIVFPAEAFDAVATLRAVQEEKCTALYGVPTMFVDELELLQDGVVSSEGFQYLRTGIAAGSSIPAELMRRLHRTLNLTELSRPSPLLKTPS
ncbi:hypothetical protein GP486_007319 [Trichoglossum hirsutum]|uniref:AMP-dependent synthetase/ligase domain-containing protein n=1 Tax=Trichoglossum hirsutum TaxID=265104 RepID=A0A9P8IIB1_9PEZI|nr:hypothetical protein GP486_007319 [Trichoglossum hirsutum]